MSRQDKQAKALRRQIRYVMKVSGGRLELTGSRQALLSSIGRFIERMKFVSREEGSRALGIKPSQFDYLVLSYRKLLRASKNAAARSGKKLGLTPVKVADEAAAPGSAGSTSRPVELVLESGVRVTVESADAAIELLDRLEQRKRLKAAS
jgi:hypothetical protein